MTASIMCKNDFETAPQHLLSGDFFESIVSSLSRDERMTITFDMGVTLDEYSTYYWYLTKTGKIVQSYDKL